MKKLLLLFFLSACFLGVNAQGGETPITTWNLSGNAGTSSRNFLGTTDTVPLIFRTTGIERMRITADGKIGIGTYQPQAKLHIEDENIVIYKSTPNNYFNPKGALLFTTEISNIQTGTWVVDYLTDNTNCGLNFWHRSQYNLANWNFYSHLFLGDTGNVGIGTFTPTAKLDVVGAIKATDATFSGTLTTTNLNFTGNLGLGTNRPKQKLHIENGNLLMKRTVPQAPGTLNGAIIFDANHVEQGYYKKWGIEYVNSVTDGYGLNFWRSDSAVGIPQKITNYSSVLFFDNGGSVGIGKNNPTAALDVGGSFKAQSAHITGKTYLDGDVGIGTNKPKQKLHVVDGNILISKTSSKDPDAPGSANGSILFGANIDNSSSMGRWGIEYLNGEDEVYGLNFWRPWNSSGGGYFNYGLFLTDDGKVGVGKKDPQTKLDVAGALKATSATITGDTYLGGNVGVGVSAPNTIFTKFQIGDIWTFHDGSANKTIGRNFYWDGGKYVRIKQGFASQLSFSSDGDIVLQTAPDGIANSTISSWNTVSFKNNGDVAIGTTSQQAKLDVSGAVNANSANIAGIIKTKEVQVTLAGWPDYVFDKDYKLPTLNEVEQFIAENRHLPNVPTAAEVEANGLNIGEMNAILIQKVEELTLYILDLQKQINALKQTKGNE